MSTSDLALDFHPLTFLDEGDAVTVGRTDIDSYCVLPADGAFLLRRLTEGVPPAQAAREYEEHYGETVDVGDFVSSMSELGFLRGDSRAGPTVLRGQRLGQALFSGPAWVVYAALVAAAAFRTVQHPDLVPHYRDLFFTDYLTLVVLALVVAQTPLLLLHEVFHLLAGRRIGLRSHLGIGRRLWFVVIEATMDGLVTVPRRRRYLPILAGMLADLLLVAGFVLIAAALRRPDGTQPMAGTLCLGIAFSTLLRLAWQLYFYLRTDLYYLAVTAFGCIDLHESAIILLRNRFHRLTRRPDRTTDESVIHPRDLGPARWYAWLVAGGYGFSFFLLATVALPTFAHTVRLAVDRLAAPTAAARLDAITFIGLNLSQFGLLGYVVLRDRLRNRPAGRPANHQESA
jgi:hypothetical protein